MIYAHYVALFGFAIQMAAAVIYCRSIVLAPVTPNRVSWLLWAVIPLVATFIALRDGAGWAALPVFAAGLAPTIVLLFAIGRKSGTWHFTPFSILCLVISLIALVIEFFGYGIVAVIAVLIAELAASLPTIHKAWRHPETESALTYFFSMTSAATALIALETWAFVQAAFPALVVTLMLIIALTILLRKRSVHDPQT